MEPPPTVRRLDAGQRDFSLRHLRQRVMSGGWFHCSVKPVSRAAGRSVVAAAAYRLGARLDDREYGTTHDYTRRGGIAASFTLAPADAPAWALQPEQLWNAAEKAENRRNSQVGRECELALPSALDPAEREAVARRFAQALVDRYGVAVSVGIHEPSRHGDDRNHHAHLLMTTRVMEPDGLGKKTRLLDDRKTGPQEVTWMRETAASLINDALAEAGSDERVSHLSFEARGIDRIPTEHLGPSASEMERRDPGSSDRGDRNRGIEDSNHSLDQLVAELAALDAEIAEAEEQELDARYGAAEPEPTPATPREAAIASFEAAIRPARENLATPDTAIWTASASFDAATQPFIAHLERTGETWLGARLWQRAAELYHAGLDRLAELGRDARDYWQQRTERDRDHGPEL